ncbi:hypothetical protein ACGFMK_40325 [Amycolatopsis sp. NPDC049252]|uniref:hypothetical protein n=1 Tax=Amycolatopsis sp. NPDC049252 TaxID=3363933 RepID=UPI00371559DF
MLTHFDAHGHSSTSTTSTMIGNSRQDRTMPGFPELAGGGQKHRLAARDQLQSSNCLVMSIYCVLVHLPEDGSMGKSERTSLPSRNEDPRGMEKMIKGCLTGVGALYVITGSLTVTVIGTVAALVLAVVNHLCR